MTKPRNTPIQIIYVNIRDITPYEKNPRKNKKAIDTVAASLEQYGFQQPIVLDKNNTIIVGHTRYTAAKKLGFREVPVIRADTLTDSQCQAYRIMDNRSSENSEWDEDLLYQELSELLAQSNIQDVSFDTGFTESELNKLFAHKEDPIDQYLKTETYRSKQGDLWQLGDHKLLCGDSTLPEHIKLLLTDSKVDMIWEDPPYGISYETANGINYTPEENEIRNHKIANDDLSPEELDAFLNQHLEILTPYTRPGTVIYWCHDIRFNYQFRQLLETHKYHVADTLIWKKNTHSTWLSNYAKYYEPILYGWRSGGAHAWYAHGMQANAWAPEDLANLTREELLAIVQSIPSNYQEISREPRATAQLHPTVKPVKLIMLHIINSSKKQDIIYDGFAGSGSTLIACEKTQRQARCIEYEPKFVDVIIRRWQDLTGLKAQRSDGVFWDDVEVDTTTTISELEIETHG